MRSDEASLVERARLELLRDKLELGAQPDLAQRMLRALRVAQQWGVDDKLMGEFIRLEAAAPGFHEQPAVKAWITRSGRSASQRFADYLCLVRWRGRALGANKE
jgi:hypothetical protein